MAACLHMLSDRFNYGLVGSSEPYDALIIPWCSSPITDYLMSGDRLSIVHDGAAFSRTEKVGFLANHPTACRTLKVCWAGKDQGTNCGVCEKCTRTRLNFLAVGVASPACFQEPLDMARITSIPLQNTTQLSELQTILRYARHKGIVADWVTLLQKRIAAGIGDGKGRSLRQRTKSFRRRIKKLFARQMSRIMPQRA
jgi:hypothetical protein